MSSQIQQGPNFAILIISASDWTNRLLQFAQKKTWVRDFDDIAPVYFVRGNGRLGHGEKDVNKLHDFKVLIDGLVSPVSSYKLESFQNNIFTFDSVNGWDQILPNTIGALESITAMKDFDYIIRTNLSTYWNVKNTLKLLKSLPKMNVYAGPIQEVNGFRWVEGDAIIMSADVVNLLLNNKELVDNRVIDDLSISHTLSRLGVVPLDVPRPWLRIHLRKLALSFYLNNKTNQPQFFRMKFPESLTSFANIRCKNPHKILGFYARMDPLIFIILRFADSFKREF
jgi:hypothetical protein